MHLIVAQRQSASRPSDNQKKRRQTKFLRSARINTIITSLAAAASHSECRRRLIQIVAQHRTFANVTTTIRSRGCLSNRTALPCFQARRRRTEVLATPRRQQLLPKLILRVKFANGLEVSPCRLTVSPQPRRLTDQAVTKNRR
jgi:hypothetical protein